ncbi:transposase [Bradyrhizobium sp. LCT2]|nr:transposase [Bradyrhizobium sp. LCT2]
MRYDLTDFECSVIEPLLPKDGLGRKPGNNRRVLNGIFWVPRADYLNGATDGDVGRMKVFHASDSDETATKHWGRQSTLVRASERGVGPFRRRPRCRSRMSTLA